MTLKPAAGVTQEPPVSDWQDASLGDLLTLQRGFDITKKAQVPGPVPVVSSSGTASFHNVARARGPGVVIGRKGSLGTAFFVDGPYWPHDTTLWVKDFKGNDPFFCYLLLKTLPLASLDAGSSNPTLNRNHAHTLPVRIPLLRTQQRIAALLAAFDELFEINERRIELLEGLARSLYREWFVRLRYSGRSPNDPPPASWTLRRLSDVAHIVMGQSPRSEFYNRDGIGLPFHQGVSDYGALLPIHRMFSTVGSRVAEAGDILCSVRAPVGRLNLADDELILGRGLAAIRRRDGRVALMLEQLRHALGAENSIGGGTIFKAVGKDELSSLRVREAPADVSHDFESTARVMLDSRVLLTKQCQALAATRDLLLPRLVTGRLDISDIVLGALLPADEA